MPKLTKRLVDASKPGDAQKIVWDTEVKGFGLRVMPSGVKSYVLNYRTEGGNSRRYTIGKHGSPWTCEDARQKAVGVLRGLASGIDPLVAKTQAKVAIAVADLVEMYLVEGLAEKPNKKASSWATDTSNLRRHVIPLLGAKAIKSLTPQDIARFQADVTAGRTAADVKTKKMGRAIITGGKGTAARSTAILGAMLALAVRRGLITKNPAMGVEIVKGEKMERFLTESEVAALGDALKTMVATLTLSQTMANAIRLLLLTGCRRNEICSLEWSWIDFQRSCVRLPDSKTGAKVVPLADSALDLLKGLDRTSRYVLGSSRSEGHIIGIQKAWHKVRSRATAIARQNAIVAGCSPEQAPDLSNVRLHDLRHSYASFAVADGATLFMVGKVLGHRQSRTTEIYAHIHDDPLRALADRTGRKIASALNRYTAEHA